MRLWKNRLIRAKTLYLISQHNWRWENEELETENREGESWSPAKGGDYLGAWWTCEASLDFIDFLCKNKSRRQNRGPSSIKNWSKRHLQDHICHSHIHAEGPYGCWECTLPCEQGCEVGRMGGWVSLLLLFCPITWASFPVFLRAYC